MSKKKTAVIKVQQTNFERGALGKDFHIASYRFPLKEAQRFERRAISLGLTRATLLTQLMLAYNAGTEEPKGVKAVATAHPTVWGKDARKKHFKSKGMKVPQLRGVAVSALSKALAKKVKTGKVVEKPTKKKTLKKLAKKSAAKAPAKRSVADLMKSLVKKKKAA